MNAKRLLASLSSIGDDPDRILQLRKIVVALAISGRLDARAASLRPAQIIEAVNRLKLDLGKPGTIQKHKNYPEVKEESLPETFADPSRFAPLGELARIEKGKTGIQQARPGPFPLVVTAAERATCDHYDFEGAAAVIPLVSSTGHGNASLNRLHYQEGQFALGTILVGVFPHDPNLISPRFLFEYLSAFKDELLVSRMTGTANVTLTIRGIAEVPIPLVCPEVQKKVDELMALCDRLEVARMAREATRDRLAAATFARLNTPDLETFQADARFALDALPALTTRPDQIKQLRQTILYFAARGKLVPQYLNDEPASELLKRIAVERGELVKRKEIRREEPLDPIQADELPFEVPVGWIWARIGDVFLFTQYGTSQKSHQSEQGIPVLTMGNVQNGLVVWSNEKRIPESSEELPALFLRKFDLLYNRTNSAELVGKTGIYLGEDSVRTFASYLIRLRPSLQWTNPHYVNLAMNTPEFRETQIVPFIKKQTGQANVNGTALKNMLIPIAPLAEQHRIVTKVDELMALCDRLEASLTAAAAIRRRLLGALLAEALEPSFPRELEAAE